MTNTLGTDGAVTFPRWAAGLRWAPVLVLGAAAVVLTVAWDSLPASWPVHWNARGQVNGWARRDFFGVYGPLVFSAVIALLLEGVSAVTVSLNRALAGLAPVQEATRLLLRAVATAQALIFASLGVALPLSDGRLPVPALVAGPIVIVLVALTVSGRMMSRALEQVRAERGPEAMEGYHALYYSNANDPRLWVPKLAGMGWTVNFAHRWAWPVMLLLVGVPLGLALLGAALAGR